MKTRNFKFRAWDKIAKTMYLWPIWLDAYIGDDNMVVQQFIGLLDKNGREIYEGDIVHRHLSILEDDFGGDERILSLEFTGVVSYAENEACFKIRKELENGGYEHANFDFKRVFITRAGLYIYTVIGNIFENPNLI